MRRGKIDKHNTRFREKDLGLSETPTSNANNPVGNGYTYMRENPVYQFYFH